MSLQDKENGIEFAVEIINLDEASAIQVLEILSDSNYRCEEHLVNGFQVLTIIIGITDLIVTLLTSDLFIKLYNKNKVMIKLYGSRIYADSPHEMIQKVLRIPGAIDELEKGLRERNIEFNGHVDSYMDFISELKNAIEKRKKLHGRNKRNARKIQHTRKDT